jgi:hypothetical protein
VSRAADGASDVTAALTSARPPAFTVVRSRANQRRELRLTEEPPCRWQLVGIGERIDRLDAVDALTLRPAAAGPA